MPQWTASDMPDQTGRIAIVTGANSGLGCESALALARKGAQVIMAARSAAKAEAARDRIVKALAGDAAAQGDLESRLAIIPLDLASLDSVRAFAAAFQARHDRLDLLINNAGVMAPPRTETADGFELQFGVNHLGHFALTGLLLGRLTGTPGARVVTVSSNAQYLGRLNFDDLQGKRSYNRYIAYSQSKLANVLFAFELGRRLAAAGRDTLSIPVHPGFANTNLQRTTTEVTPGAYLERAIYAFSRRTVMHSPAAGARPQLYAATMPGVKASQHYAVRWFHLRGQPELRRAARAAYDEETARRLWDVSEALTGVTYDFG